MTMLTQITMNSSRVVGAVRFIVILLGIVLGYAAVNLYSGWRAWTSPASATALNREI